jgi:D-xylose 1-dehydrogenase
MTEKSADYPSLHDKVVVITGGATGIGEAITRSFAKVGAKVVFLDIQDSAANQLADSIAKTAKHKPLYMKVNVTDIPAVEAAFQKIRSSLGPVSVLVNNAARDDRQPLDEVTAESFDASLAVNLKHVFFACRAVAKDMRELGGGSIINFTSGAWVNGVPNLQAYTASKAGIAGLTNTFARQFGPDNIRVNCVAPGFVTTDRQTKLWDTPEGIAAALHEQCIPRRLEPDDITGLVLFLAADESKMITKQMLLVNAGRR